MTKVALSVTLEFQPESRADILRALLAHRERCLKEESGTLRFDVLVPLEDPAKFFLFELHADRSAFGLHGKGESIARFRSEVSSQRLKVTSVLCEPAAGPGEEPGFKA